MKMLVRRQIKDQIWHEVIDAPRPERHREDTPYPSKDTQQNSLQTNSLRGKHEHPVDSLDQGKVRN